MGVEWKIKSFGDLVSFVSEKSKAENANFATYISTENMLTNFGGVTKAATLPNSGSVTRFQASDTLFSNIRTYFKKVWEAKFDGLCSNDVLVFRSKNKKQLSPNYLYHICRWEKFTEFSVRTSKGAKMPRGDKDALTEFQVHLPSFPEQKAIAHILGTLDEKIELNRRMNETLEAMARTLFKDWFVDFGPVRAKMKGRWQRGQSLPGLPIHLYGIFPDLLVDSEVGKIPAGWQVKALDEIAEFLNGLALQKYPAHDSETSLPVIKIAELRNGISSGSNRASREIPQKYIIKDGDFLFSWSGSLLTKFWTEGEGTLNQHLFKVTSNDYPMWFVSHWVQDHLQEFQSIAAAKATTMGHIQRGHLKLAMVICPPQSTLLQLGVQIAAIVEKTIQNDLESRTLATLRDTLLPKLISGQIRIKDAERIIGDAT